jgi:hypothetical protein
VSLRARQLGRARRMSTRHRCATGIILGGPS